MLKTIKNNPCFRPVNFLPPSTINLFFTHSQLKNMQFIFLHIGYNAKMLKCSYIFTYQYVTVLWWERVVKVTGHQHFESYIICNLWTWIWKCYRPNLNIFMSCAPANNPHQTHTVELYILYTLIEIHYVESCIMTKNGKTPLDLAEILNSQTTTLKKRKSRKTWTYSFFLIQRFR